MEWNWKIVESIDDMDLDIFASQLLLENFTPPVAIIASNKLLKKLMPEMEELNEC